MERLLIKFTKNKEAKYISHLDTLRTLHRAFRRADLPIAYSKGFNPHASISIAAPLSLGIGSNAEYADIELESYVEGNIVMEKLNSALPNGIRILKVININKKMPSSMAIVEGAKYIIGLNHKTDKNSINAIITSILNSEDIMMLKKTKSGEKMVNIRPLIKGIDLKNYSESRFEVECMLQTGSRGSLGPEAISDLLKRNSNDCIFGYPDMVREEIYCEKDGRWMDLATYFLGK